jgi:hypothetical protein
MAQMFISYPRESRDVVERLVADLRSSGYDPFFDEQLAGGQRWWDELLSRIEASTAFVPIIGPGYLNSTPCQLESAYAAALGKPFLPIVVEPTPPQLFSEAIASAHWTEYHPAKPATVFAVIRAINELPPARPLPPVMPARPVVPISYMTELQNEISREDEISRSRQLALVAELKPRLKGPDREAALMLLGRLRQRTDVTYQAAVDIDELLAGHGGAASDSRAAPQATPQVEREGPPRPDPGPPPQAAPQPPRASEQPHQQGPPSLGQQQWQAPGQQNWPAPGQQAGQQPAPPWPTGQPIGQPIGQPLAGEPSPKPDNFYLWTILSTVLCCLPVGVVGIVYSSRVDSLWAQGKFAEAIDASNKAKMWAIISAVCGIIAILAVLGSA